MMKYTDRLVAILFGYTYLREDASARLYELTFNLIFLMPDFSKFSCDKVGKSKEFAINRLLNIKNHFILFLLFLKRLKIE